MEQRIDSELWLEFIQWGSGFTLEAERDYQSKKEPLFYHLTMNGLFFHNDELMGENINKLMKEAIKIGRRNQTKLLKRKDGTK